MSSPLPVAGWYPDPSGGSGQRWWDGQAWSAAMSPGPVTVSATSATASNHGYTGSTFAPGASSSVSANGGSSAPRHYGGPASAGASNKYAFITFAVVAVYLVVALESRVVLFGVLPLGFSLRSKRAAEPLAPIAIAAAVVGILIAAIKLFAH
jgi:hypothetical protein